MQAPARLPAIMRGSSSSWRDLVMVEIPTYAEVSSQDT
jgi:hypothetical protein